MDLVTLLLGLIKILAWILFIASIVWLIYHVYTDVQVSKSREETQDTEKWQDFAKHIDENPDVLDEAGRKWVNDHRYTKWNQIKSNLPAAVHKQFYQYTSRN